MAKITPNSEPEEMPRVPMLGPIPSGLLSLFLVSSLVFFGPFGLFLAPLGLIPVARHEGDQHNSFLVWFPVMLLLIALSVAGLGMFALTTLAAYVFVVVLPVGSLALWKRSRAGEGRWAAWTLLGVMCIILAGFSIYSAPIPPQERILQLVHDTAGEMEGFYTSIGMGRAEAQLMLDQAELALSWGLPSMLGLYLLGILFWIRPRLPMLGLIDLPIGPFEEYRSEEWLPVFFAGTGIATVFLHGTGRWFALNLLLSVLGLYFIHGLAIIRAHLVRWFGRGWFVRWGATIVALQGPLPIAVVVLGLVDAFHPLRPQVDDGGLE